MRIKIITAIFYVDEVQYNPAIWEEDPENWPDEIRLVTLNNGIIESTNTIWYKADYQDTEEASARGTIAVLFDGIRNGYAAIGIC